MPLAKHLLRACALVTDPLVEPRVDEALMGSKQVVGTMLEESCQTRVLNILAHGNRPLNALTEQTII